MDIVQGGALVQSQKPPNGYPEMVVVPMERVTFLERNFRSIIIWLNIAIGLFIIIFSVILFNFLATNWKEKLTEVAIFSKDDTIKYMRRLNDSYLSPIPNQTMTENLTTLDIWFDEDVWGQYKIHTVDSQEKAITTNTNYEKKYNYNDPLDYFRDKIKVFPVSSHLISSPYSPFADRIITMDDSIGGPHKKMKSSHPGIDIATPIDSPVKAFADGTVCYICGWLPFIGYGNFMIIDHYNGYYSVYAHLDNFVARLNQVVKAGDLIAYSGNTGYSTGPHLHFEFRRSSTHNFLWSYTTMNPLLLFNLSDSIKKF